MCHEQNWLVYQPVLSVMDNNGWYFSQFFSVVDKYWLVYQPVLSVVDKNGWYINRFCRSWTILGGIFHGCVLLGQYWLVNQPCYFSFMDCNDWFISMFCLSWKILVGISPYVVCDEQKWLVYHPVLSVMDSNGWYIS